MRPTFLTNAALAGACLTAAAHAGAPAYDQYDLYVRGNFASNPGGAFNIPGNNFISNETSGLNEKGEISVRISPSSFGGPSVWAGDIATGAVISTASGDPTTSTTTLNEAGRIVWTESFGPLDGIYGVNIDGSDPGIVTNRPIGASSWSAATVNDAGNIGYRAGFAGSGNALVIVGPSGTGDTIVATETGVDFLSLYSFIFTPSFNNNDRIACKVRVGPGTAGSRPDEIRLFNLDSSSTLIAQDTDGDPMSPFASFDNSVALNDLDEVAFAATLPGGSRGVFLSDGTTVTTIATEADADVSEIEFFAPDVNNHGVVVFRAFDGAGLRAIFAGNGDWLVRVVTENDILPSDQGDARVDQNTASSPVFGGGPTINDAGQVVFNCGLTPPDNNQIEWGTGVYVATPTLDDACPGDCDANGAVDFTDLVAMLADFDTPGTNPGCDADGSGKVNFSDLVLALSVFGPCPK